MKEKKHRVEDALQATRAALEEGIVPGGGVALLNAADAVKKDFKTLQGDEKTGRHHRARARGAAPAARVQRGPRGLGRRPAGPLGQEGPGPERRHGEFEDLVKAGIIDPTMVTRSALQNAASIAKNILTTEVIVVDAPEKNGGGAGMGDIGGMGGMM